MIIIIAFKGAIRDFFTISSQHRELSPTRTLKWPGRNPCANHVQHIERLSRANVMLRATWYEGTAQLLSLTELKVDLFELYFIGWTIKPMKEGRKQEYPEKTPGDELQKIVCLFVGCLTSQQHASASQGRICSDNFTCCHTEIQVADQTFYLTQSQYTDTGPTSPSADPITPGVWQGSHWSANV